MTEGGDSCSAATWYIGHFLGLPASAELAVTLTVDGKYPEALTSRVCSRHCCGAMLSLSMCAATEHTVTATYGYDGNHWRCTPSVRGFRPGEGHRYFEIDCKCELRPHQESLKAYTATGFVSGPENLCQLEHHVMASTKKLLPCHRTPNFIPISTCRTLASTVLEELTNVR